MGWLLFLVGVLVGALYINNWMILLDALLIGIVTSIVGSISFLLLLWFLKPKLNISENVAFFNHSVAGEVYTIKIINPSKWFDLYDVSARLYYITDYDVKNGRNGHLNRVDLLKNNIQMVPKFNEQNKDAPFARLLFTNYNIKEELKNNNRLLLQIKVKHELSGFAKVFEKEYYSTRCVKIGTFAHGNDFTVNQ